MRTKNAKRLWPVPGTLGVMALATLLVFGLLVTTGAQPAAAQDADCTITINTAANDVEDLSIADTIPGGSVDTDLSCNAFGGTATIKFVGPGGDPGAAKEIPVYVLVDDKGGNLRFYPNNAIWQSSNDGDRRKGAFYDSASSTTAVGATKYSDQDLSVPRAARQGGRFVPQSTTITVEGEGTVHVYLPEAYGNGIVRNLADISENYGDCEPACNVDTIRPPSSAQMSSLPRRQAMTVPR